MPPAATSHTSCQLQSGPMAAITCRAAPDVLRHEKVQRSRADVPAVKDDEHRQHEAEEREPEFNQW